MMKLELVGFKHYGGLIDITDPCYDRDVWCRMNATVKDGKYVCGVWRIPESIHPNSKRIGVIGIYLDGFIPDQQQMDEIGFIGVDAGIAGFFIDKPDYNDEQWSEFCNSIKDGDAWLKDVGFFSQSGYGDGEYGVYAYKQDDEIVALEIRFI